MVLLLLLRAGRGVVAAVLLVSHDVFLRHQQRVHVFETLEFGLIDFLDDAPVVYGEQTKKHTQTTTSVD